MRLIKEMVERRHKGQEDLGSGGKKKEGRKRRPVVEPVLGVRLQYGGQQCRAEERELLLFLLFLLLVQK